MKFIFFIIIFCPLISLSQIQSGEIIYKVKAPETLKDYIDTTQTKVEPMVNVYFERKYKQLVMVAPTMEFTLNFNKNESYFAYPKMMESDNNMAIDQMVNSVGVYGNYYSNQKENFKIIEQSNNIYDKTIRIKATFDDLKWEIGKETKTIAGYLCQQATVVVYQDSISQKEIKVTAWFAPELPFQFGPMEYSGLPGIILGLETRNNFYFYAESIKLNKQSKKITVPSKGRMIEKEEYDKRLQEFSKEMIRRYEESR